MPAVKTDDLFQEGALKKYCHTFQYLFLELPDLFVQGGCEM